MSIKRVAAIDIGSNAPRLLIAELKEDSLPVVIDSIRATLSLGVDTYNENHISENSLSELSSILKRFKTKLREYKIKDYRVVATSAVREAHNRDFVVARIKQRTGFDCEIISNAEERYLHNLGISETFEQFNELTGRGSVVLDMGAGSVQVSAYEDNKRLMSQYLKLGYLRVNELFSDIKARSSNYDKVMNDYISSQIQSLSLFGLKSTENYALIAVGNDLNYIKNLSSLIDLEPSDFISREKITELYEILQHMRSLELTLNYAIPADVAENILTIVMILVRFLESMDLSGVYLPNMQLGYGMIIGRAIEEGYYKPQHSHYEDLMSAVERSVVRYGGDLDHLRAKERDGVAIYKVLAKKYNFAPDAELKIRLACKLSEIGKFIKPDEYQENSAQIVLENEFIGISDHSTEIIANIIRYSTGTEVPASPELSYRSYSFRSQVIQGAAILRLVNALEYTGTNKIENISTALKKNKFTISVSSNDDLGLERWLLRQNSKLIEELFGIKVVLKEI